MTKRDERHATPHQLTKEKFLDVVLPKLPNIPLGRENAIMMLQDIQQPPGVYLVALRMNGETLPGMFVAASGTGNARLLLSEKLKADFPELKMAHDLFAMRVELQ
jgi:hypothetical protein